MRRARPRLRRRGAVAAGSVCAGSGAAAGRMAQLPRRCCDAAPLCSPCRGDGRRVRTSSCGCALPPLLSVAVSCACVYVPGSGSDMSDGLVAVKWCFGTESLHQAGRVQACNRVCREPPAGCSAVLGILLASTNVLGIGFVVSGGGCGPRMLTCGAVAVQTSLFPTPRRIPNLTTKAMITTVVRRKKKTTTKTTPEMKTNTKTRKAEAAAAAAAAAAKRLPTTTTTTTTTMGRRRSFQTRAIPVRSPVPLTVKTAHNGLALLTATTAATPTTPTKAGRDTASAATTQSRFVPLPTCLNSSQVFGFTAALGVVCACMRVHVVVCVRVRVH